MANMNKQGKTNKQYQDSAKFAWYGVVGMTLLVILLTLLGGCATIQPTKKCCEKKYVITEWDGDRQINWYSSNAAKYAAKYCGGNLEKENIK